MAALSPMFPGRAQSGASGPRSATKASGRRISNPRGRERQDDRLQRLREAHFSPQLRQAGAAVRAALEVRLKLDDGIRLGEKSVDLSLRDIEAVAHRAAAQRAEPRRRFDRQQEIALQLLYRRSTLPQFLQPGLRARVAGEAHRTHRVALEQDAPPDVVLAVVVAGGFGGIEAEDGVDFLQDLFRRRLFRGDREAHARAVAAYERAYGIRRCAHERLEPAHQRKNVARIAEGDQAPRKLRALHAHRAVLELGLARRGVEDAERELVDPAP